MVRRTQRPAGIASSGRSSGSGFSGSQITPSSVAPLTPHRLASVAAHRALGDHRQAHRDDAGDAALGLTGRQAPEDRDEDDRPHREHATDHPAEDPSQDGEKQHQEQARGPQRSIPVDVVPDEVGDDIACQYDEVDDDEGHFHRSVHGPA